MQLIAHRINSCKQLLDTPHNLGVEVDIRSRGTELIIHHDPFEEGESFDIWLREFNHKTLILNVKEEGLEPYLIEKMQSVGIEDYFFLDQSFPFLIKYAAATSGRSAVRFSEFESIDTVLSLAGKVGWVWVDCFTRFPLKTDDAIALKEAGFKLCLVSPELQGREAVAGIKQMRSDLNGLRINADAVCTKRPDLWS
ncbi:MAG: phosphatidylinositol-specific phospholipase C/glycerophosphodiester phosphodiesterase family protein [Candidatus Puniceispirillaceae bacterium]